MPRPLHGLRVLNTRPLSEHDHLSAQITEAGGYAISFPALSIQASEQPWQATLLAYPDVHAFIFISPNAVDYFFQGLACDHTFHSKTKIIAIGSATAHRLATYKITVDAIPPIADSEHLLDLNVFHNVCNKNILIIKGTHGRPLIEQTLEARGAHVMALPVYETRVPVYDEIKVQHIWQENQVDLILYTSQQSIINIFNLFKAPAHPWLCEKPSIVISSRLSDYAATRGIKNIILSRHDDILRTLEELANEQREHIKP